MIRPYQHSSKLSRTGTWYYRWHSMLLFRPEKKQNRCRQEEKRRVLTHWIEQCQKKRVIHWTGQCQCRSAEYTGSAELSDGVPVEPFPAGRCRQGGYSRLRDSSTCRCLPLPLPPPSVAARTIALRPPTPTAFPYHCYLPRPRSGGRRTGRRDRRTAGLPHRGGRHDAPGCECGRSSAAHCLCSVRGGGEGTLCRLPSRRTRPPSSPPWSPR